MRLNLRPALRALTVSAALLAVPSLAGASFIVGPSHVGVSPDHGGRFNPISFNPTSVLINLQVNHTGTGSFKIIEPGYNGKFTGRVNCILPIGKPHLEIKGDTGTITVPKQLLAIDIGCSAAVHGAGNRVGIEPILISITL